jgi:hypothetical protein
MCYWLLVSGVTYVEIESMSSGWAGLPGFLLTLPLSALVVSAYFVTNYLRDFKGYNVEFTEYQAEYGYLVCAFLNAFLFYPLYLLWMWRKVSPSLTTATPPPPEFGNPR